MEQPSARESPDFGLTSVRERAVAGAHEGSTRVSSRFASTRLAAASPPCPRLAAATTDRHQTPTPASGHPEHVCLRSDEDGACPTLALPDGGLAVRLATLRSVPDIGSILLGKHSDLRSLSGPATHHHNGR